MLQPHRHTRWLTTLVPLTLLLAAAPARGEEPPAAAPAAPNEWLRRRVEQRTTQTNACMDCHADDNPDGAGEVSFPDGNAREVGVNRAVFDGSVHGGKLSCRGCHREVVDYPHPEGRWRTAREYELAQAATCKRCHFAYRMRLTDSVHYRALQRGRQDAPTCVDCHGAHDIGVPDRPRAAVNARCAQCHEEQADAFATSVHGRALLDEDNPDVPVCTSCHGAHTVQDTDEPAFRAASHALCAQCHSDAARMARYNLSANVLTSYMEDFHGASNVLYLQSGGQPTKPMVTCVDCHGAHDITSTRRGEDPTGVRRRLGAVCRECHQQATPEFADAWVSHWEPSLQNAPLVWAVKAVYAVMIPGIMLGLVLHILLHLWRLRTHR